LGGYCQCDGGWELVVSSSFHYPLISEWTDKSLISPSNMRKVFQKIEHNNYLPSSTAGHGFTGFFNTMMPTPQNVSNPGLAALNAAAESFAIPTSQLTAMLARDPNALDSNRDHSTGIFGLASHTRVNGQRWSSRDYIQDTINAGFPLTLSKNSLATRVLFDKTGCGSKPRATGVEYLVGKSLYKADARYDANNKGVLTQAIARKEVILSGGAFNTPQLLMLSGIGPAAQLSQFNISLVVDSPGVGTNLQDNQEIPTVGLFPTVQYGSAGGCIMRQTPFAPYAERDIFVMQFPGVFRGFWPSNQTNTNLTQDIPGSYGISLVKMHPQNRAGTVRLLSSDPRDMPEINFNLFEQGRDVDIGAMKDTVAWARKIFGSIKGPVGPVEVLEPKCESVDAGGSCGKVDEDWIEGQTFGHHPTSTAAIGADGDPNAVLDSRFNVRGVKGLRVVDASVFPQIPGVFPVVSTFMVGQKGSDVIIEDANKDVCGSST
jgi:choline dehydrogenase